MTETNDEKSINARAANAPDVKKNKGGRPPKAQYQQPIMEVLAISASEAAERIRQYIARVKGAKNFSRDYLTACFFVIEQTIGKARQKVEHSGGIMTYGELAKSADNLDAKPRPILAEVLEIARKYQADNPGSAGDKPAPDGATGPDPGVSTDDKPGSEKS